MLPEDEKTLNFIKSQYRLYPEAGIGDIFKGLYQSTFGCAHLVNDVSSASGYIEREHSHNNGADVCPAAFERLDGDFVRVHLSVIDSYSIRPDELAGALARSSQIPAGSICDLERRIKVFAGMNGISSANEAEILKEAGIWKDNGYPPYHHTSVFNSLYHPAYRVIHISEVEKLLEGRVTEHSSGMFIDRTSVFND